MPMATNLLVPSKRVCPPTGVFTYADGSSFEGEFENGLMEGKGFFVQNGTRFKVLLSGQDAGIRTRGQRTGVLQISDE